MPVLKLLPALLLVTLLLIVPLPLDQAMKRWPTLLGEIENAAHVIIFAWFAWIVFRGLRHRYPSLGMRAYPVAFAITVGFGLGLEIVQALVGRDSAWVDLANDACGSLAALLLVARTEARAKRTWPLMLGVLAVAVLVVSMAPLGRALAAYGWRATHVPILWRMDSVVPRPFSHWYPGQPAVLELREVPQDWQQDDALEIDIRSVSDQPLQMNVSVYARHFDGKFRGRFSGHDQLQPREARTLRISAADIPPRFNRRVDTQATGSVVLVQQTPSERPLFVVDELRLVRENRLPR